MNRIGLLLSIHLENLNPKTAILKFNLNLIKMWWPFREGKHGVFKKSNAAEGVV